jgi:tRNA pseudouridine38-40 synthase
LSTNTNDRRDELPSGGSALKVILAYDGSGFAGSQRQPVQRTVQAVLEDTFSTLAGRQTAVVLAGRTDEGVHAAGQVAGVADVRPDWQASRYEVALNALLPDDCGVERIERVEATFHARFDARWREYRYRIWSGPRQPLARSVVWRRHGEIDVDAINDGASRLNGTHDVASFAGGGEGVPWSDRQSAPRGTVRTIMICSARPIDPWWGPAGAGELIELRIVADGFLPRMVRTIAGVLEEIGQRRREPAWVDALLAGRDRRMAGETAPAHGLTLWRVGYAGDVPEIDAAGVSGNAGASLETRMK